MRDVSNGVVRQVLKVPNVSGSKQNNEAQFPVKSPSPKGRCDPHQAVSLGCHCSVEPCLILVYTETCMWDFFLVDHGPRNVKVPRGEGQGQ